MIVSVVWAAIFLIFVLSESLSDVSSDLVEWAAIRRFCIMKMEMTITIMTMRKGKEYSTLDGISIVKENVILSSVLSKELLLLSCESFRSSALIQMSIVLVLQVENSRHSRLAMSTLRLLIAAN